MGISASVVSLRVAVTTMRVSGRLDGASCPQATPVSTPVMAHDNSNVR
jgi:hypothetical protein